MRNDNFFKSSIGIFVLASLLVTAGQLIGISWAKPSMETTKMVIVTVMGVSGSIIGFLVIYFSISLETMKKSYGRYALRIFRKDTSIWAIGYLFAGVIVVGLFTLVRADQNNTFWLWLFNMTCLWFALAVLLIFPFGNAILNKSSTGMLIDGMIDRLTADEFKQPPPRHSFPATIYWVISESDENSVDVLSNILYHNINEGNSRVATQILLKLYEKSEKISRQLPASDLEKVVFRYLDILQTAFDIASAKKDNVVIKIVLVSLRTCSGWIAGRHLGQGFIEKTFDVIINIIMSFIEAENESLINESFWTYYHMCEEQVSSNLPDEKETWEWDGEGYMVINSNLAWKNEQRFDAIDKAMTYDLSRLVDRTFLCKNDYIIESSVNMLSTFVEMIAFEDRMGSVQRRRMGSSAAYNCAEGIKRFIRSRGEREEGYLNLYVSVSNITTVLQENSPFSKTVFDEFISVVEFLLEEESMVKYDLEKLGGLGRLIVGNSGKINDAGGHLEALVDMQKKVKEKLTYQLKSAKLTERAGKMMKEMIVLIQNDIKSYKSIFQQRVSDDVSLEALINSFQQ